MKKKMIIKEIKKGVSLFDHYFPQDYDFESKCLRGRQNFPEKTSDLFLAWELKLDNNKKILFLKA